VVEHLATACVARANAPNVQRAHIVAVARSQEVCEQAEIGIDYLDGQTLARVVISALVDYESEVVSLKHEANVDHGAALSAEKHACLGEEETAADGHIVPRLALHEAGACDCKHDACDDCGVDDKADYRRDLLPLLLVNLIGIVLRGAIGLQL